MLGKFEINISIRLRFIKSEIKATIYTRVSNRQVLTWIQKVTETTPLIMVVGGFASFNTDRLGRVKQPKYNKPTFDIELISQRNSKSCSKAVKGYKGRAYAVEGIKENMILFPSGGTDHLSTLLLTHFMENEDNTSRVSCLVSRVSCLVSFT